MLGGRLQQKVGAVVVVRLQFQKLQRILPSVKQPVSPTAANRGQAAPVKLGHRFRKGFFGDLQRTGLIMSPQMNETGYCQRIKFRCRQKITGDGSSHHTAGQHIAKTDLLQLSGSGRAAGRCQRKLTAAGGKGPHTVRREPADQFFSRQPRLHRDPAQPDALVQSVGHRDGRQHGGGSAVAFRLQQQGIGKSRHILEPAGGILKGAAVYGTAKPAQCGEVLPDSITQHRCFSPLQDGL